MVGVVARSVDGWKNAAGSVAYRVRLPNAYPNRTNMVAFMRYAGTLFRKYSRVRFFFLNVLFVS